MNIDTRREEDLFDAARKIKDPALCRAFLTRACGADTALRARIEGLLAAESEAEQFFEEVSTVVNQTVTHAEATSPTQDLGIASLPTAPGEEPIGTRIGRYKLLRKIGEGGCGVVYMAEQQEPVRRRVALKIIKLGMETKSVIARFEAERQALAMMDHPNIARVFDAGATDRGPPYFVMELVRGVKITEYCDQHRLSTGERLDLFIQVCHAIQHAHQKGIIHGDIKPSNILVSLHDNTAVPKVIDFGISKATEARLTDRFLFTAYTQLIGTPAYMSPEQAEMSGLDIDTRSDIYSLGVLLYELLTGRTPFDGRQLLESGLDAMRRTLRETEPPRPSVRLNTLQAGELTKTAQSRQAEPPRLVSLLRGDLDWIVMKALEKDRGRRYETANGLAMDIQRHLNNEPVMARPPSRLYRFKKLVRRNRVVFAAGGAVAFALIVGTSTSTWLFLRERDARRRAVSAEQQQARLRHEAEVREGITQAVLLVSQERFEEADGRLKGISLTQPTVEGASVLRSVGEWYAVRNQWSMAADRLSRLLRVDQLDGWDGSTLDYLRCGPALIEDGNRSGYEAFREEAVARFSGTSCPFPDRILKIVLLLPTDARRVEGLEWLASGTEKTFHDATVVNDAFQAAWRALSMAIYYYRKGDQAKATEWGDLCLACPEYNASRSGTAHVVLAMAEYRRGRMAEAVDHLSRGREIIETKFKGRLDGGGPVQGFWFDWVFARILLREAVDTLNTAAPAKKV